MNTRPAPPQGLLRLGVESNPVPRGGGFVSAVRLDRDRVPSFDTYPFSMPAIHELGGWGIRQVSYEETETVRVTRDFLERRPQMLGILMSGDS